MEKEKDKLYVSHILELIAAIEKFSRDVEKQDAIVRRLQIIGEASNRVSPEIKKQLPEVPWKKMLGMRNIIVHDYMYVASFTFLRHLCRLIMQTANRTLIATGK